MELFKQKTAIDFMGLRKWSAIISITLFLLAAASLANRGLNLGLEFTGGTQIQLVFDGTADLPDLRDKLHHAGYPEAVVQSFGRSDTVLVRVGQHPEMTQDALREGVLAVAPNATVASLAFIGPQVGKELATNGALAFVVAMIVTMIYIALRFEYRFAVSAAVALIHDPILILGIFSFFQYEFDLNVLAALLTVLGYSLNDTIVVFDRVRENFRRVRKSTPSEIINLSVNQTLSRTIMTSALTLLVVLALFFYGGPKVHGFALALIIGIVIGTYSSIYVAGALSVKLGLKREDFMPQQKESFDSMP